MNEAQRQGELIAALAPGAPLPPGLRETGARAARGIEAYRANAAAIAERALASAFATVRTMVGDEGFRRLAREFWLEQLPLRGDLGEWGDAFPAWLAAHARLTPWPWLADSARLDLAIHRNERAADASFDPASLNRLGSIDPKRLLLVPMPGTALLRSTWPIATIYRAHQVEGEAAERAFDEVREAIAQARGEQALVARDGWRAAVYPLDVPTAAWMEDLLAGVDLDTALTRAGGDFDFAAWLGRAIREVWLRDVAALPDGRPAKPAEQVRAVDGERGQAAGGR